MSTSPIQGAQTAAPASLPELVAARQIPELLRLSSGEVVEDAALWPKRRAEIVELFAANVYGRPPNIEAKDVQFTVVKRDPLVMNGAATLKQVRVTVRGPRGVLAFGLVLFTPNKRERPAPTFLLVSHHGPKNLDPTRREKTEFWPAEELIARGYGAAAFFAGEVDPDQDDDFQNGVHGVFDPVLKAGEQRAPDAWGTIAAWSWGASRALDYLETDPAVDVERVAVVGHSRGGKTALWAGASDPRFALVVSNCSGNTGAALSRGKGGETITQINTKFPHWFARNYKQYNDRPAALPLDQHWLLATIAPRLLYVVSAQEDGWADPQSEFLSAYAASPAYRLLGHKGLVAGDIAKTDVPLTEGKIGYHRRTGKHGLTLWDWTRLMDFADAKWASEAKK